MRFNVRNSIMTKIIHPDETLNIYYRVSEDTNELEDIVHIEKDGEEENISDLPDLQNTKIIQWSPDSEHEDEEFEFDIDGISEIQEIYVSDIIDKIEYQWSIRENSSTLVEKIENKNGNNYNASFVTNNWFENYALNFNGEDNYALLPKEPFQKICTNAKWGIAFTFESNSEESNFFFGQDNGENEHRLNSRFSSRTDPGSVSFQIRPSDTARSRTEIYTKSTEFNDGEKHRVFIQCTDMQSTDDDLNIYIDNVNEELKTHESNSDRNDGIEIDYDIALGAWNYGGNIRNYLDTKIDNFILYSNPLRKTIEKDYNSQPWS